MATSREHAIEAYQKAEYAIHCAEDYKHKADRATTVAIVALTHAVLSLRPLLDSLSSSLKRREGDQRE